MAFDLKYLGHSGFEIKIDDDYFLIDPLLVKNPEYSFQNKHITDIFLTHGHSDHIGKSIDISKSSKALITAVFELANYCTSKGALSNGINLGSWLQYSWGKAMFLPAFHSSSNLSGVYMGCPAGILFDINNIKIFHAGDTCLNYEMKIVNELYKPDIAILPIGGVYTMGIEEAMIATEWINPKIIIPVHYNTFDNIKADVSRFKMLVEHKGYQCAVMAYNDVLSF